MSMPPQPPDQEVPRAQDLCHPAALGQQVPIHRALKAIRASSAHHCHPRGLSLPLDSEDKRPPVFA